MYVGDSKNTIIVLKQYNSVYSNNIFPYNPYFQST